MPLLKKYQPLIEVVIDNFLQIWPGAPVGMIRHAFTSLRSLQIGTFSKDILDGFQ